jgi:anti-sigma-K factor RskA
MSRHETELLGGYVLGVLEPDERGAVERHLDGCEHCRLEVRDLREIEAALGEMPPEALIEGPPEDGDLLLARTLREVRAEQTRSDRQRRGLWAAAAVVAGVAVLAGGTLLGRATAPTALPAPSTATQGAPVKTATDPTTGATMAVSVSPAAGWVRIHTAVAGVPVGTQCRLIVVARNGARTAAGSWLVSPGAATAGSTVDGVALVAPDDVASVTVETFAGQPLVSVPI